MVASRWTTHRAVVVDCPACDRPLPPILVDVDARADGERGRRHVVSLTLQPQELDAAWWAAARAEHPGCIPDGAGAPR